MVEHTEMRGGAQAAEAEGFRLEVLRGVSVLQVKSWMPGSGTETVVLAGRELPVQVGAIGVSGGGGGGHADVRVLCVGPKEWLVVARGSRAEGWREEIKSELSRRGLVALDVSDGLAVLEARGSVSAVLSKGCGLDFHPRSFPAGRCARTRLAQIPVVVECIEESGRFELMVARSYLPYLQSWLIDAAMEFRGTCRMT